jgi:ABC-type Mn2+/Zn2+ transport system permease subunit
MTAPALYSIVLVLLTAIAAGLIGSFALMKRMSLAGDVISHIALPGLGLALLLHLNPLLGAATTLFLGTPLIWQLQQGRTLTTVSGDRRDLHCGFGDWHTGDTE